MTDEFNPTSDANTAPPTDAVSAADAAAPDDRAAQLQQEVDEYKNNWLRATADFKNYKRRAEGERDDLIRNANAGLILKLLPIMDDFERAISHIPAEIENNPWLEGVKLVQRKLQTVLEGQGVQAIEAVGTEFDPNFHEAVLYEETDSDHPNMVVEELQRGYKLGDRVLRPTMVKVGK